MEVHGGEQTVRHLVRDAEPEGAGSVQPAVGDRSVEPEREQRVDRDQAPSQTGPEGGGGSRDLGDGPDDGGHDTHHQSQGPQPLGRGRFELRRERPPAEARRVGRAPEQP
jgi:hypothetical protein